MQHVFGKITVQAGKIPPKQSAESLTSNTSLLPAKNSAAINAIPATTLNDDAIKMLAISYYNKMMAKLPIAEKTY
jgi:hypothetical protein